MSKIKCMVIDDEPLSVELLSDYIGQCGFLELTHASTDPLEALSMIGRSRVDLIFLDVQMKALNGLQFIKLLDRRSSVILITAYPDYALQGYDMNIIDYLLKPILFERFLQATQKAARLLTPADPAVETGADHSAAEETIFVRSGHKIIKIGLKDILFIESRKEYVAIYMAQSTILTLQKMSKMENLLPGRRFIRVHRSYIIAFDKIETIEQNRIFIGNRVIPIGETYRAYFYDRLAGRSLI